MKRASIFSLVLAAIVAVATLNLQAQQGRLIEIEGNDQMKFSVTEITAKPGELLTVRLRTVGKLPKMAMAHNFVLLAAKTDAAAFAQEAALAGATQYIPAKRKGEVLASTDLAGAGETVEVTFKAPAEAGSYDYICSFPGHFAAGMRGKLVVK
ncbi:MAG: plastocyanin/azurin family copper-binding protein [Acidobacteriota bacterium]